jgi:hypothetical protein
MTIYMAEKTGVAQINWEEKLEWDYWTPREFAYWILFDRECSSPYIDLTKEMAELLSEFGDLIPGYSPNS